MTDNTNDVKATLEALTIADLRSKATKNFGLKLTREHTKDDIVRLIMEVSRKANFAKESEGELKPGWARIKIHRQTNSSQEMVFFNCNGYQGFIPIGVEVDVPIKVLEILDHAEEMRISKLDEFGNPTWALEISYPYSLLAKVDGPDPKPGMEAQRDRKLSGKRKFFKKYLMWPTDKMYERFILSGNQFNPFGSDEAVNDE